MTLDALIMLAGAIVAALPFMGFPHVWLQWLLFIAGVCVFALGVVVRRRLSQRPQARLSPLDGPSRE